MQLGDWLNAAVNLVIGIFLGIAIDGLALLLADGLWLLALFILISVGGLLLFNGLLDMVFERLFPSGIRPAPNSQTQTPKPLLRRLSLPVGLVLGVILARLGLASTILAVL